MTTGIYKTTDPNYRIKVVQDAEYPTEDPDFPYAPGVLDGLIKCFEEGNYYGVIVLKRVADGGCSCQDEFEQEDAIWGFAGYDDVAKDVAERHFGLTVTEKI